MNMYRLYPAFDPTPSGPRHKLCFNSKPETNYPPVSTTARERYYYIQWELRCAFPKCLQKHTFLKELYHAVFHPSHRLEKKKILNVSMWVDTALRNMSIVTDVAGKYCTFFFLRYNFNNWNIPHIIFSDYDSISQALPSTERRRFLIKTATVMTTVITATPKPTAPAAMPIVLSWPERIK